MRQKTIMAEIQAVLRDRGLRPEAAHQMYELFQEALETATGANQWGEGLAGYVPAGDQAAVDKVEQNAVPILTAAAIAFAGAEIAEAIRGGMSGIERAIDAAAH
jgi:ABC-type amino acid transport system permease subunit